MLNHMKSLSKQPKFKLKIKSVKNLLITEDKNITNLNDKEILSSLMFPESKYCKLSLTYTLKDYNEDFIMFTTKYYNHNGKEILFVGYISITDTDQKFKLFYYIKDQLNNEEFLTRPITFKDSLNWKLGENRLQPHYDEYILAILINSEEISIYRNHPYLFEELSEKKFED